MVNVRSGTAALLIRTLPAMLGFEPRDAIVVVGLTASHRTGIVMRLDREDCLLPEVARALARSVAVHLTRAGYPQACIVSFRDGPLDEPDPAVDAVAQTLDEAVAVRDAWLVSDGRFRSQWCTDFACCPRRGLPVAGPLDEAGRDLGVDVVARRRPATSADAAARRRAMRARERALLARARTGSAWDAQALDLWRRAVNEAMDGRMPADAASGRLLAALDVIAVRDAIVVDLDELEAAECGEVLAGRADERIRESLWGLVDGRPARDRARVEAAVDLALHLAGLAAGSRGAANAAPMTIAAIGHWWLGDRAAAEHLADAALAAEPGYRLAQLVAATLIAGVNGR